MGFFCRPSDGNAHGATGSATGVNGEDLSSLLNLGASFTNVPGGTAHWTFAGNADYAPASGDVSITITRATPTITWNNPADIVYGTALSATQLNATASVAGSLDYSPSSGTLLNTEAVSLRQQTILLGGIRHVLPSVTSTAMLP